jgi:perosamine synthetase
MDTAVSSLAQDVLSRLARVLPGNGPYPLHEPEFAGREWDYIKECLDTGWVSSAGSFVDRFEKAIEAYTGARHAVATVNGTAAMHTCLVLAGVGRDDEVLLPSLTFVATANAVSYCGGVPHFVECEERSLGVDAAKLEAYLEDVAERSETGCRNRVSGRPIKALIVMHCFGLPADLQPLQGVCERFGLVLIEDAAESLGATYRGVHTGCFGKLGALSFNGNKIVTTGGGGAILTQDAELAARARHLTTTARVSEGRELAHDRIGFNYRLPNLNAALGCAQFEELPGFLAAKRRLAARYIEAFGGFAGGAVVKEPEYGSSNYWLVTLLLDKASESYRLPLLEALERSGYLCRPVWTPMHLLRMYAACPHMDLGVTESIHRRGICLPSSARLADLKVP